MRTITNKYSKTQRTRIKRAFKGVDRLRLRAGLATSDCVVRQIVNGHLVVSAKRALDIERICGVPRYVMRPDLYKAEKVDA